MSIQIKNMTIGLVGAFGIAASIISCTQQNASSPENMTSTETAAEKSDAGQISNQASKLEPGAILPTEHPPLIPPAKTNGNENQGAAGASAKFTHFRVGNKNVKSIFADGNTMWIGTSGGVIRYDTKRDDHQLFNVQNGLLANGVFSVGKIGSLISVGTYGGGVAMYDHEADRFKIYNVPDGLADSFVYDALEMPNGDVWIATWSGANLIRGGDISDPSKWETFTVANTNGGLPNDWVYGLAKGKDDELWLATEGGLARYKDGTWTNWNKDDGLGAPYDLVKDDITFKRDPAEVSSHHAKQKVEMDLQGINTSYNPNYIVAMDVAQDGTVWVGTWGAGLCSFDGEKFTVYTTKNGLPSNHVFMLHVDQKDKVWIGTADGLASFNETDGENMFDIMTTDDGLFSNTVFSMTTQEDGTLWVGSYGGISKIRL